MNIAVFVAVVSLVLASIGAVLLIRAGLGAILGHRARRLQKLHPPSRRG